MRHHDTNITRLLDQVGSMIGRKLVVDEISVSSDSIVVANVSGSSNRIAIRTSEGSSFSTTERALVQELADMIQRDVQRRADYNGVEARLRILERENIDLAMKNRALAEVSARDSLTGLYTRWYMVDKMEAELNRALRHGSPMSVLMLDIDQMGHINQAHGNRVGDLVVQSVGQVLRDSCRVYDVAARYGGEEFCLMLPETKLDSTVVVAERIRRRIETSPVLTPDQSLRVTASVGIASLETIPDEAILGASSLLERADRALYTAKESGRNRVVTWDQAMVHRMPHLEH